MKKIYLCFVLLCLLCLTGCVSSGVPKGKMMMDLYWEFAKNGQEWEIEDITIFTQRKEKDYNAIELTADIKTRTALLTRMYKLEYDYHEINGWVLRQYTGIHEERWKVRPASSVPTDLINDTIFKKESDSVGGHIIKPDIENVHFKNWNRRSNMNQDANYIKDVKFLENDLIFGNVTLLAYCETASPMLEIRETFKLQYTFNSIELCWEPIYGQSVDHSYTLLDNISGTYVCTQGSTEDRLTFSEIGGTIIVSGDYWFGENHFNNAIVNVDSAFELSTFARHSSSVNIPVTFVIEDSGAFRCAHVSGSTTSLFIKR